MSCDDDAVVWAWLPEHGTTIYEAEGEIVVTKVKGGWRKFEGKWSLGFGPKKMVFTPIGPIHARKKDAVEDKHLQSSTTRRGTGAKKRR